jgi:folate-binding protein YgfZ
VVLAGDAAAVHQGLDRVLFPADGVRLGPVQPAQLVRWVGAPTPVDAEGNPNLLQPGVDLGAGAEQPAWLQRDGEPLPTWLEALPELSAEQVEQRRLRSGFPAAPGELNDDINPFELGLAPWVSLNKGCYVGQETLAKLATYDGVKQQLRHWRAERTGPAAADACAPGTTLTTAAGERAGVITSTLAGPDGLEGLALVRRTALGESQLLAGPELPLQISRPSGFVDPPVGAGGRDSGGSAGGR